MESFVEASAVLRSTQSCWTFVVLNFVIWQRCSLANVITFWMICSLSAGTGRPQVLLKSGRELGIYLSWPKAKPLIPLSILHCNSLLRLNSYWYIQDFKLKRFLWTEPLSLTPYGIRTRVCWKIDYSMAIPACLVLPTDYVEVKQAYHSCLFSQISCFLKNRKKS